MLEVAEAYRLGSAEFPFIGETNLWIETSLRDSGSIHFVQWLLQQALEGTAPGQLHISAYDAALTGLTAPLDAINSGGEKLLRVLQDERELLQHLEFLKTHIQGVHSLVRGQTETLTQFRNHTNYPVEGYKLTVIACDVTLLSDEVLNTLAVLLKAGPAMGTTFIIHSLTVGVNPFLMAMCDKVTVKNGQVSIEDQAAPGWRRSSALELQRSAAAVAHVLSKQELAPIAMAEVQDMDTAASRSSADGLTFCLGRFGLGPVEITVGDELNQRHNILITGAVGQGKSNLISVMVHSLCQRYSPDELELYLLDFKEGVTLQALAYGPEGSFLPHARVLGLEADRLFALNVFEHLFRVYKDRMRTFKENGVVSLREYRHLGKVMPRVLLIVDEFQMMFSDSDRISDAIAGYLIKAVRLFRACGLHVVLASQTIGGNTSLMGSSGEGLFGQVPIRIALKNSLSESHATLGVKNDAAAHLRSREAIVNLDYGSPDANRKVNVAFADERVLAPLRHQWWRNGNGRMPRPFVFAGGVQRSYRQDISRIATGGTDVPKALVGNGMDVGGGPIHIDFPCDVARNVVVVGGGPVVEELWNISLSLAESAPNVPKQFVFVDLQAAEQAWLQRRENWRAALDGVHNSRAEVVTKEELEELLDRLTTAGPSPDGMRTYVIGLGLDRQREMPLSFQSLCQEGPVQGMHLIGWWAKYETFRTHVGYNGDSHFDVRLALRLDTQSTRQLMADPLLDWKPSDNRGTLWDQAFMNSAQTIIPYELIPN